MESKSKIFIHSSRRSQPNEMTTIAVAKDVKEKISEFGNKGETFSNILLKLYKSAVQRQLQDLLYNEEGFISIDEAIARHKKKWQK